METKPRKIAAKTLHRFGPPVLLENIVGRAIPSAYREDLLGDMRENYTSWPRYVLDVAATIHVVLAEQILRLFCPSPDALRSDTAVTGAYVLILTLDVIQWFVPRNDDVAAAATMTWKTRLPMMLVVVAAFAALRHLRYTSGWSDIARFLAFVLALSGMAILITMIASPNPFLPNLDRYSQWTFLAGTLLFCVQRKIFFAEKP
jgi:hypothetical protein